MRLAIRKLTACFSPWYESRAKPGHSRSHMSSAPYSSPEKKKRRIGMSAVATAQEGSLQRGEVVKVAGLTMTSLWLKVPLNHEDLSAGNIVLYAREVCATSKYRQQPLPYLLFLQGGPGFECARPTEASGWIKAAVQHYCVILMDQRGTGLSTPITAANVGKLGSPEQQADYLSLFRLDSIVNDAECLRVALQPPIVAEKAHSRWSVLGQSYGGFCAVRYLSEYPASLAEVLLTGGLPPQVDPAGCNLDAVYTRLYSRRVLTQNDIFYRRFPQDEAAIQMIVAHLHKQPGGGVRLPGGSLLTVRGFQSLGLPSLGTSGGMEKLHFLLERAWDGPELSLMFLKGVEGLLPWGLNPLYATLHESIYCQGMASQWAANRVRLKVEFNDDFDALHSVENNLRVNFTGEMVFPWMFDEIAELQPFKAAAEILAAKVDWPCIYSPDTLQATTCPTASASYYSDMYVDFDLAQETARYIPTLRQWITNEYMHSGIRDDGQTIFDHLLQLVRNGDTPY